MPKPPSSGQVAHDPASKLMLVPRLCLRLFGFVVGGAILASLRRLHAKQTDSLVVQLEHASVQLCEQFYIRR